MPTCLTLCGHRAGANYCSHWALLQLLPSGLTTAERTWGAWKEERYAGRGSGALQLSIRCGDDPLLGWGGLEAEVRCRSVDSEHLYAFNCSPLVCSCLLQPTQSWECVPSHNTMDSPHPDLKQSGTNLLLDFPKVGLKVLVQEAHCFSPTTRLVVERFIPFPAVGKFKKPQGNTSWGDRERLNPLLW